jgi:DNA-binding response OmpR family regulator
MDQHILIVDDDEMFRRILAHPLRSAGYTVVEATSGHEALEIISSRPSPIVITDRDMPNMGGLELCRALRGCEAFGVLYIMMITATDNEDSLVEAIDAGADDFITKPLRPRVMLARVRAGERVVELHGIPQGRRSQPQAHRSLADRCPDRRAQPPRRHGRSRRAVEPRQPNQ